MEFLKCSRVTIYLDRNFRFRLMPENFERRIGESLYIFLKDSSVRSSQSCKEKLNTSLSGLNYVSLVGFENLFQGHTSWQISQPNNQFSNFPFISAGIDMSFSSIVK